MAMLTPGIGSISVSRDYALDRAVGETLSRAVGLPRELGGISLDEIGATGFGLAAALEVAQDSGDFQIAGFRVAVQGFGAVGRHATRFLAERGAVLVATVDSAGTILDPNGLDVQALIQWKAAGNSVASFPGGRGLERDGVIDVARDIWIPAARPDVLDADNVGRLHAWVVAEGANIPVTPEAEAILARRGVLVLPDFIVNAGGVICGAVEYAGGSQAMALDVIAGKIRYNLHEVLERARHEAITPRQAALAMAGARVRRAMTFRRTS